ncbi:MAG: hypothetical protein KGK44_07355 [Gammaproteobacteria bacterium]|nr:hypothetical protein [Gammaproteobacteria bacterium]
MAENKAILLPRTLVNQILHAAQSTASQVHWGFIADRDGMPEKCHALDNPLPSPAEFSCLMQQFDKHGQQPWAIYSLAPGDPVLPEPAVLQDLGITRFLAVSLGTRGVLQLRGWRVENDALTEIPVETVES